MPNTRLPMTKQEEEVMLQQIWHELRYVRQKLDTHVDQNDKDFQSVKEDVAEVKSELSGHKVKLGIMFSSIGLAMSGVVAWVVNHVK
jgi:hypothetical protein